MHALARKSYAQFKAASAIQPSAASQSSRISRSNPAIRCRAALMCPKFIERICLVDRLPFQSLEIDYSLAVAPECRPGMLIAFGYLFFLRSFSSEPVLSVSRKQDRSELFSPLLPRLPPPLGRFATLQCVPRQRHELASLRPVLLSLLIHLLNNCSSRLPNLNLAQNVKSPSGDRRNRAESSKQTGSNMHSGVRVIVIMIIGSLDEDKHTHQTGFSAVFARAASFSVFRWPHVAFFRPRSAEPSSLRPDSVAHFWLGKQCVRFTISLCVVCPSFSISASAATSPPKHFSNRNSSATPFESVSRFSSQHSHSRTHHTSECVRSKTKP